MIARRTKEFQTTENSNKNCKLGCDFCNTGFCRCQNETIPEKIECVEQAEDMYVECLVACPKGDVECLAACARENDDLIVQCPCNEQCPHGCPCAGYECPMTTTAVPTTTTAVSNSKKSVLILNTHSSMNAPTITDAAGRADTSGFWFKIEENAEVYFSCSLSFQGRNYIYGGSNERNQLSVVDGCALKRIGDLPFAFRLGACTSTPDQVFLCFDLGSDYKTCRVGQSANGPFVEIDKSIYAHKEIRIETSKSKFDLDTPLKCILNIFQFSGFAGCRLCTQL